MNAKNNRIRIIIILLIIIVVALIILGIGSCQENRSYYKRSFTDKQVSNIADQLTKYHNFGSIREQVIINESLALNPRNAQAWYIRSIPYARHGMPVLFNYNVTAAVILDPLLYLGNRGYAFLYYYRDYGRALVDFDALDALTPNSPDYANSISIHFWRGLCYLQLGNYEKAISYFDRHMELELKTLTEDFISSRTYLYQGIAYYKLHQYDKAISIWSKGHSFHPDNADILFWMSKAHDQLQYHQLADDYKLKAYRLFKKGDYNMHGYVEEFYQLKEKDF